MLQNKVLHSWRTLNQTSAYSPTVNLIWDPSLTFCDISITVNKNHTGPIIHVIHVPVLKWFWTSFNFVILAQSLDHKYKSSVTTSPPPFLTSINTRPYLSLSASLSSLAFLRSWGFVNGGITSLYQCLHGGCWAVKSK